MQINTQNKTRIIKIQVALIFICLFIAISQYGNYFPGLETEINNTISAKAEEFTELYFENPTKLPKTVSFDEEGNFSFTVHNVLEQSSSYQYEVSIREGNEKTVVEQGILILKPREISTVRESFISPTNQQAQIYVKLLNTGQFIDFWINKQ